MKDNLIFIFALSLPFLVVAIALLTGGIVVEVSETEQVGLTPVAGEVVEINGIKYQRIIN